MSSCFSVSGYQYFILNKGHCLLRKQQKSHDLIRVDIFNQVSCVKEVFFSLSLFSWMWRLRSMSASPSSQLQQSTGANLQRKHQQSQQTPVSACLVAPVGLLTRHPRVLAVRIVYFYIHPAVNRMPSAFPHSNMLALTLAERFSWCVSLCSITRTCSSMMRVLCFFSLSF